MLQEPQDAALPHPRVSAAANPRLYHSPPSSRERRIIITIISRMNRYFARHPTLRKWAWFVALYVISIVVFGLFAFGLQALVPK